MLVALGSKKEPKVRAAQRAFSMLQDHVPGFLDGEFRLIARAAPSGTSPTPRSTVELMAGARNRAETLLKSLRAEGKTPDLSLGLEGGLVSEVGVDGQQTLFMLEAWAYATNGTLGSFGSSGCLPLPNELAEAVIERGEDLGPVADRYFHRENVAGRQGTFGFLTAEIVTREEAFVRALLHALAPFYNRIVYRGSGPF